MIAIACVFFINLVLALTTELSLDYLWPFINTIQIINLLPLMNMSLTPIFHTYFTYLNLVNLSFMNLHSLFREVFNL